MKRTLLPVLAAAALVASSCESASAKNPVVVMETSMGPVKIELDPEHAPATVENFLKYVDDRFYDGTVFHRVIPDFMVQGGGFEKGVQDAKTVAEFQGKQKRTRGAIRNEARNGLHNVRGTIAMARTNDPDSATAQFFINTVDNSDSLDPNPGRGSAGYCVFGKVIDGMDVVDKIRRVKTRSVAPGAIENVPEEDVVIKSVRRAE
jgi:cyclophilin family peptidyl-prolyl cis-trans isomerase